MASIIKSDNGVSSGITGIVQSADSSGQLVLQTTTSSGTATTAVTIDNTQKVTFANAITPSTTNGIVGTTLGDNAVAGSVGEYISSTVIPNTTGLTSSTPTNATSISLTAGDWDVSGCLAFNYAATTVPTVVYAAISTTSATLPGPNNPTSMYFQGTIGTGSATNFVVPTLRISITTTTTVYLVGQCSFTISTAGLGGYIRARRVR